jgi:hypothetical protein
MNSHSHNLSPVYPEDIGLSTTTYGGASINDIDNKYEVSPRNVSSSSVAVPQSNNSGAQNNNANQKAETNAADTVHLNSNSRAVTRTDNNTRAPWERDIYREDSFRIYFDMHKGTKDWWRDNRKEVYKAIKNADISTLKNLLDGKILDYCHQKDRTFFLNFRIFQIWVGMLQETATFLSSLSIADNEGEFDIRNHKTALKYRLEKYCRDFGDKEEEQTGVNNNDPKDVQKFLIGCQSSMIEKRKLCTTYMDDKGWHSRFFEKVLTDFKIILEEKRSDILKLNNFNNFFTEGNFTNRLKEKQKKFFQQEYNDQKKILDDAIREFSLDNDDSCNFLDFDLCISKIHLKILSELHGNFAKNTIIQEIKNRAGGDEASKKQYLNNTLKPKWLKECENLKKDALKNIEAVYKKFISSANIFEQENLFEFGSVYLQSKIDEIFSSQNDSIWQAMVTTFSTCNLDVKPITCQKLEDEIKLFKKLTEKQELSLNNSNNEIDIEACQAGATSNQEEKDLNEDEKHCEGNTLMHYALKAYVDAQQKYIQATAANDKAGLETATKTINDCLKAIEYLVQKGCSFYCLNNYHENSFDYANFSPSLPKFDWQLMRLVIKSRHTYKPFENDIQQGFLGYANTVITDIENSTIKNWSDIGEDINAVSCKFINLIKYFFCGENRDSAQVGKIDGVKEGVNFLTKAGEELVGILLKEGIEKFIKEGGEETKWYKFFIRTRLVSCLDKIHKKHFVNKAPPHEMPKQEYNDDKKRIQEAFTTGSVDRANASATETEQLKMSNLLSDSIDFWIATPVSLSLSTEIFNNGFLSSIFNELGAVDFAKLFPAVKQDSLLAKKLMAIKNTIVDRIRQNFKIYNEEKLPTDDFIQQIEKSPKTKNLFLQALSDALNLTIYLNDSVLFAQANPKATIHLSYDANTGVFNSSHRNSQTNVPLSANPNGHFANQNNNAVSNTNNPSSNMSSQNQPLTPSVR